MRAFLALPLPQITRAALVAAQGLLPSGRPVPEDNLHLTLVYLGDIDEACAEALDAGLSMSRLPAPRVRFGGLGTFAEMERGLFFAEVLADETLSALQAKTAQIARGAGAELPRRRFRPHVTLARAARQPVGLTRDRMALAMGAPVEIPGFEAHALGFYSSHLKQGGAVYDLLASYPLG